MSDENIENNQTENQNKCEDKKSCWVKTQPTNSGLVLTQLKRY